MTLLGFATLALAVAPIPRNIWGGNGNTRINMLTYNIQMLPGFLHQGAADIERAESIAERINSASPRFDIVALQEVFDDSSRTILDHQLRTQFNLIASSGGNKNNTIINSGLFFASRFPIIGNHFTRFSCGPLTPSSVDALADKGYLT